MWFFWLCVGAKLAQYRPNPFNDERLQIYEVSRDSFVQNLWRYRFAIPILYGFNTSLFETIAPTPFFNADVLKEINPFLLLPTMVDLFNPFPEVQPKHYVRADSTVDLPKIMDEIVNAYREKRSVDFADLSKKYSLLATMVAMEEIYEAFDESQYPDDITTKALLTFKEVLDKMTVKMFRRTLGEPKPNQLFFHICNNLHGYLIFEKLTTDVKHWPLIEPLMNPSDRVHLLRILKVESEILEPITNLLYLAKLITEFPHIPMSLWLPMTLPVNILKDNMPQSVLRRFLEHQMISYRPAGVHEGPRNIWDLYIAFDSTVDYALQIFSNDTFSEVSFGRLSDFPDCIRCLALRRLISRGIPVNVTVETAMDLGVSLLEISKAVQMALLTDPNGIFSKYEETLENIRDSSSQEGMPDPPPRKSFYLISVSLVCMKHPDIKLVDFDLTENYTGPSSLVNLSVFEAALRSNANEALKKTLPWLNESIFRRKNYCPLIEQVGDLKLRKLLAEKFLCLKELATMDLTRDCSFANIMQPILSISNMLIVDQVTENDTKLYGTVSEIVKDNGLLAALPLQFSPLFFLQFGMVVPNVSNFSGSPLPLLRQVIRLSSSMKPYLYEFALQLLNSDLSQMDRQQYLKLMHLLFEDLPSAMDDDLQLANYLQTLMEKIADPAHPFHAEMAFMKDHLFYCFQHRVIDPKSLENFRKLHTQYHNIITGSAMAIQMSETPADFKRSCQLFFESSGFDSDTFECLLEALGSRALPFLRAMGPYMLKKGKWYLDSVLHFLVFRAPKHFQNKVAFKKWQSSLLRRLIFKHLSSRRFKGSKRSAQ